MDDTTSTKKLNKTGKPRIKPVVNPVNWFTESNYFKSLQMTGNIYTDALYAVGMLLTTYNKLDVVSDVSITNYNKQSIGNRENHDRVSAVMVVKSNKIVKVNLPLSFMPARADGEGYQFTDKIAPDDTVLKQIWPKTINRSFGKPDLESLAWTGYFTYQLYTGCLTSSESTFKTDALHTLIHVLNPSALTVTIYPRITDDKPAYVYTLTEINSLLVANNPRVRLMWSLPERANIRSTAKHSGRRVVV